MAQSVSLGCRAEPTRISELDKKKKKTLLRFSSPTIFVVSVEVCVFPLSAFFLFFFLSVCLCCLANLVSGQTMNPLLLSVELSLFFFFFNHRQPARESFRLSSRVLVATPPHWRRAQSRDAPPDACASPPLLLALPAYGTR